MNMDTLMVYIKTEENYSETAKYVEASFNTPNYELDGPFIERKDKKIICLIEEELDRKLMKQLATLKVKTYNYLTDKNYKDKKSTDIKSVW